MFNIKLEIEELSSFYNDPTCNYVDCFRFCDDVQIKTEQIFVGWAQNSLVVNIIPSYINEDSPYLTLRNIQKGKIETCDEILKKLQTIIFKKRIQLYDFFLIFDELMKGYVTQQQFPTVVVQKVYN
jgi:hypothetical protein